MLYPLSYGGYPQNGAVRAYPTTGRLSPMARVLVVDDADSIRFLIRTNLEIAGFEVAEAIDGQECLDLLLGETPLPDLLTVDVMMPRRDGISAVLALRSHPRTKELPIVMVTTQAQASDVKRGMDAGVNAYITKPFDPEHLVETVRSLIGDVKN